MRPATAAARWRDAVILVAILGALWQVLYWAVGDVALTPPVQTMAAAAALVASPAFWPHMLETGLAVLQGYVIAASTGLVLGLVLGTQRTAGDVAAPVLVALYSIPKITLYPVILLLFGIGMPAKVAFGALHGVVPVVMFTVNAMRAIPPVYLRTASVLRLSPLTRARRILLPAALPDIVTGLRVGFALTLVGTVMGEMFGAQRGVGYLLMQAMGVHDMERILSVTVILVAAALTVGGLLLGLDARLHRQRATR